MLELAHKTRKTMYSQKKEIVLFGIDKSLLKPFVPEIKIRMNKGKAFEVEKLTSIQDAYQLLKRIYGRNPIQEHFIVLLLSRTNKLTGYYRHTIGTTSATIADISMIVGLATKALAHGVIISHNHPSGAKVPSEPDKALTQDISQALKTVKITLLDHIIYTTDGYFSFADSGVLNGINTMNMISVNNLITEYPKINQDNLPDALKQDEFEFIRENIDLYAEDDDIKKYIDTFMAKLNQVEAKKHDKKPEAPERPDSTEKPLKPKKQVKKEHQPKPIKSKPDFEGEMVERIEPEIAFIRRYVNMDGKVKSKDQVLAFLRSLQKAITERIIRKTSNYAEEIRDIQANLVMLANKQGTQFTISIDDNKFDRLSKLAKSESVMPCVKFVKLFLSLQGKADVKDKAKKLLTDIENATMKPGEAMKHKIAEVKKSLRDYISGKKDVPEISESVLNGLQGLAGCECEAPKENKQQIKPGKIISSSDLAGVTFNLMGFTGKWLELIGDPSDRFMTMIYGGPGSGKSTLALEFAHYLAKDHGKRVLFVAHEEKVGQTIQEKLIRLKAFHKNLFIVDKLPGDLGGYDFLFIDSVNSHGLSPLDIEKLINKYPKLSIAYVCQTTKDGNFRGSKEWEHMADVVIHANIGVAISEKNRFGGHGEVKVW